MIESAPAAPLENDEDDKNNEEGINVLPIEVISLAVSTPVEAEQIIESAVAILENTEGGLDLEMARETLDFLIAERNRAATSGDTSASTIYYIFNDAVRKLQSKIEMQDPKESVEIIIDLKVTEAYERISRGELIHAIPLLHTALKDARLQEFWLQGSEERNVKKIEIETLLEATKKKWIEAGRPTT
jgi:hypothetical protein